MGRGIEGFSTVILLILILGSIIMFSIGIVGNYLARIYEEVKHRPSYLIDPRRSSVKGRSEDQAGKDGTAPVGT
jgi:dolichol-phosphate mannosyltransferase